MSHTQRYTSSELFHFVGRKDIDDDARYSRFIKIIKSGELKPPSAQAVSRSFHVNPKFAGMIKPPTPSLTINYNRKFCGNDMFNPAMVCFCDIPEECLAIHMQKYSYLGFSFSRAFLVQRGANPVFYNALKSTVRKQDRESYFNDEVKKYFDLWRTTTSTPGRCTTNKEELTKKQEMSDQFHFIVDSILSYTVFFDHEKNEDDPDNYYMEREWRILGDVSFNISDIQTIVMPHIYSERFKNDIPDYKGRVLLVDKP